MTGTERPSEGAVRPRLLDLFCGAGGASVGYHRAGFDVTGWDNKPHPDYPFELHLDDAMEVVQDRAYLDTFRCRRRLTALPPIFPHHPRRDPRRAPRLPATVPGRTQKRGAASTSSRTSSAPQWITP